MKPGHSPEVALTREVERVKANVSSEEDSDAQEHGILWVKNTGKFCLGILLTLVAVTASWYFERQLARLECLMSIGRSMCRSIQDAKAVPENSGCLVHLSGDLKPELPIQIHALLVKSLVQAVAVFERRFKSTNGLTVETPSCSNSGQRIHRVFRSHGETPQRRHRR